MSEYIVEFGEHPNIEDKGALREKIVRCRDCKWFLVDERYDNACRWFCRSLKDDNGFCSFGERKEGGE